MALATGFDMTITSYWMGDFLWMDLPRAAPGLRLRMGTQCVGRIYKTKRGTYWAVHFYAGNVRTAVPTEQEAKDLLMVLARNTHGDST